MEQEKTHKIILGGGCFWCIEAAFEDVKGVYSVVSGFAGGESIKPSYKDVISGKTNHAEVCQITYDKSVISLSGLLEIFFLVHDPTSIDRQGNDIGSHYRSIILYDDLEDLSIIKSEIIKYNKEYFNNRIVTEVKKQTNFYKAEDYHQEYYKNNYDQPYCKIIIKPKLQKARKKLKKYY